MPTSEELVKSRRGVPKGNLSGWESNINIERICPYPPYMRAEELKTKLGLAGKVGSEVGERLEFEG